MYTVASQPPHLLSYSPSREIKLVCKRPVAWHVVLGWYVPITAVPIPTKMSELRIPPEPRINNQLKV